VLDTLQKAGVTLNKEKCQFSKRSVQFLGHVIDSDGIRPDSSKVTAIQNMKEPTNVKELRRLLDMANHLGKFIPNLADTIKSLCDLLSKKSHWTWGEPQQTAIKKLKEKLSATPVLAMYDLRKEIIVSADVSSYGLGAVLLQVQSDVNYRPVAYASRALSNTEKQYAQIEKESLALTWACEHFNDYLTGTTFHYTN